MRIPPRIPRNIPPRPSHGFPGLPALNRRAALALGAFAAVGVSAGAFAPPCGCAFAAADGALSLDEIAPGVFVHRAPYEVLAPDNDGAIANVGLIVGAEAAAVIDTGNSHIAGLRLREAARRVTDRPIRYVVNTHMHPDHVLGNSAFEGEGVRFVGHRKLPRALSVRAETYLDQVKRLLGPAGEGTRIVLPDLLVEDRLVLDLGGRPLEFEAHPTAHTDNDLTIRDSASGTWFLGDLLFVGHVPTLDGSLQGWLSVLDRLAARAASRAVPGHGPASVEWPAAMAAERAYLEDLRTDVRRFIADGVPMGEAAERAGRSQARSWALFDEFNARNAIAAYHEFEWE
ncbi:quinoprotein relay system zinc metallohydrolase 2 [Ancylobacter oerskovii]|uniref:Quinoprotein relay system zinc metallohydrolase 2 n=1 Tax=Ancylobacter oerskovii TaxID=459519 RepID=A0ABW4Z222_9HYPH|nr:quinoprotein relay system zinc metallohydrolase 2 [Ancylobacter oerskovii]MBS7544910.1 quinoprotein relay system zinc metallohydrolase 2 [Ancylobacter oerskovii]